MIHEGSYSVRNSCQQSAVLRDSVILYRYIKKIWKYLFNHTLIFFSKSILHSDDHLIYFCFVQNSWIKHRIDKNL